MDQYNPVKVVEVNYSTSLLLACAACMILIFDASCGSQRQRQIAVIPRTTGSAFWEAEHAGAVAAARTRSCAIYWNAPQREDDVESQISLIEKVTSSHVDGLIVAPDHSLALLTPVRRALAAGIPVIIVSSGLQLPPGASLSYILSDDEKGGRMAARRVAQMLQGKGTVAVLGVDPDIIGIMQRLRSFERTLASDYPGLRIAAMGPGAFNAAEAQQTMIGFLNQNPDLKSVVTLTTVSTRAAYSVLKSSNQLQTVRLIGFEQDDELLNAVHAGEIDSIVAESMFQMGFEAVRQMDDRWRGRTVPQRTTLDPVLITRGNVDSSEVRQLRRMDWFELK